MTRKWPALAIGALAIAFAILLLSAGTVGHTEERAGWRLESGVEQPSYAFIIRRASMEPPSMPCAAVSPDGM